jgi:hypothetical protein
MLITTAAVFAVFDGERACVIMLAEPGSISSSRFIIITFFEEGCWAAECAGTTRMMKTDRTMRDRTRREIFMLSHNLKGIIRI